MKKRVLVAMSGGVDSAVTAALLQQHGYDVEGVTMKLTAGLCCDMATARSVCGHLGIAHRMIDAQTEFTRYVITDFISEYQAGRTPNPCIICNDLVKFTVLLHYARANNFDYLATGHYARNEYDHIRARYILKTGVDSKKDQSYFLYRLSQGQLKNILFPLGSLTKDEVRSIARSLNLAAAERPESQEICFVLDNDYRSFLKENAPQTVQPGDLVLTDGRIIGKHDGIAFFTVGQRRHLGVSAGERLYVVRIEPETNRVVLGTSQEMRTDVIFVSDLHLVYLEALAGSMDVSVKVRYRSSLYPAVIISTASGCAEIRLNAALAGVCPGQAAVFFDGEQVVGGGIITRGDTL